MAKAKAAAKAASKIEGPIEADGEFHGPAAQSPTEGVSRTGTGEPFEPTTPGDPSGGGLRGPDPGIDQDVLAEKGREERRVVDKDAEAFGGKAKEPVIEGEDVSNPDAEGDSPQATGGS